MKTDTTLQQQNILPCDGTVNYFGKIVPENKADLYFNVFMNSIEWKNDEAIIFGKKIITKRKVAWYGDEGFSYTYSKTTKVALPWTKELLELKLMIEKISGAQYNSCLMNLYHSGEEGVSWHSDDEKSLGDAPNIASFSLGAERNFTFKHKINKQTISVFLEHGSLLVMKDRTQTHWLHSILKTKKISHPRISLTFRKMIF
ncbi:MAG: alpha-ketoglutarate-dependent dioxygenase AlkB [Bacteroidia bacterium]|nr:alpha-ketoglutarate-dependent dioxygenase AlkB [Bacteroidia bacterium]